MQNLLSLLGAGYCYWTHGSLPAVKASGLLDKFASLYPVLHSEGQRARAKEVGAARVKLVMTVDYLKQDNVQFYLMATTGKKILGEGFSDLIHMRERLLDVSRHPMSWHRHYVLVRQGGVTAKGRKGPATRLTWNLHPENLRAYRLRVEQAAARDPESLRRVFRELMMSPMFSGVRQAVVDLDIHARSVWRKARGREPYPKVLPDRLPFMPRIAIFGEMTLADLVREIVRVGELRRSIGASEAQSLIRGEEPQFLTTTLVQVPGRDAEEGET